LKKKTQVEAKKDQRKRNIDQESSSKMHVKNGTYVMHESRVIRASNWSKCAGRMCQTTTCYLPALKIIIQIDHNCIYASIVIC
jgi:hypothetical protein